MKLFRLRFIVLGLLLCVFHVWCRTCNTEFVDTASSAVLAQVIVVGRVIKTLPPNIGGLFNITVRIENVYKGLRKKSSKNKTVTIGDFGTRKDLENCIANIKKGSTKHVFFLRKTTLVNYYKISAFPEKNTKRSGRLIRKSICRKCGKSPTLRKLKNVRVNTGKRIQISCRIRTAKPKALITWLKDGIVVNKRKGLTIRTRKKGSRLRISRAKLSDAGTYTCLASNVIGNSTSNATVTVLPRRKRPRPSVTTLPPQVTNTNTELYSPCDKSKEGWCFNNGECRQYTSLGITTCQCKKSHVGKRCQFRALPIPGVYKERERQAALEKDRTLTIIGIVIGILIFVCICIASYFLAKRRRDQFIRRQEEKKRKNNKFDSQIYIPPSYRLLNSTDEIDGAKMRHQVSFSTSNTETQTDEINFLPIPENDVLRTPKSGQLRIHEQGSPRNRLSAVSVDGPSQRKSSVDKPLHTSAPVNNIASSNQPEAKPLHLETHTIKPNLPNTSEKSSQNKIPKLEASLPSDDEEEGLTSPEEVLTPLHISEDNLRRPGSDYNPHFFFKGNNKPPPYPGVYSNNVEVGSNSSPSTTLSKTDSSSEEDLLHPQATVHSQHKNNNYSDDISWNERGSPEQLTFDKGCAGAASVDYVDKSYSPQKNFRYPRYSGNNDERFNNVRVDEPSIPV